MDASHEVPSAILFFSDVIRFNEGASLIHKSGI
jgi:hypothetical protein